MAIVHIDPENWTTSNVVQVDSDAPDDSRAILEIRVPSAGVYPLTNTVCHSGSPPVVSSSRGLIGSIKTPLPLRGRK